MVKSLICIQKCDIKRIFNKVGGNTWSGHTLLVFNFKHFKHNKLNIFFNSLTWLGWYIGIGNSIYPKCPETNKTLLFITYTNEWLSACHTFEHLTISGNFFIRWDEHLRTFTFPLFRSSTRFTFTKFKGQAEKGICKLSYMGNGAVTDGCRTLRKQCKNKLINQFKRFKAWIPTIVIIE